VVLSQLDLIVAAAIDAERQQRAARVAQHLAGQALVANTPRPPSRYLPRINWPRFWSLRWLSR
jgi:hypothetical protein